MTTEVEPILEDDIQEPVLKVRKSKKAKDNSSELHLKLLAHISEYAAAIGNKPKTVREKKPRSEAQIKAFEKARAKRAENLLARKQAKESEE